MRFVGRKYGDREVRLQDVLKNMANVKVDGADYIGGLYAQILFKSSAHLLLPERNSLSLVLASLNMQWRLSKKDLLELLAPVGLESRSVSSINAAIDSLKSVIVIDSEGEDEILRGMSQKLLGFPLGRS